MSYIQRYVVTVTTDKEGDGIGYTPAVTGKVSAIHYVKDTSNAYSDDAMFSSSPKRQAKRF